MAKSKNTNPKARARKKKRRAATLVGSHAGPSAVALSASLHSGAGLHIKPAKALRAAGKKQAIAESSE